MIFWIHPGFLGDVPILRWVKSRIWVGVWLGFGLAFREGWVDMPLESWVLSNFVLTLYGILQMSQCFISSLLVFLHQLLGILGAMNLIRDIDRLVKSSDADMDVAYML